MKCIISFVLFCVSLNAVAQASGNLHYNQTAPLENQLHATFSDGEIVLSVSGLLNAEADTFVAFFHVLQVGETAEQTDSLMTARLQKFKEALSKQKTDSITFNTDMISFVPKYNFHVINKLFSKTYNEVPDGFELQKNVIVRYRKASDLDAIVTAAAKAEIYDLVKVDYFLKDIKKQYDQLRAQCMEVLKTKMRSCEALGIKLDALRKNFAEDFNTVLPQTRYGSYQAIARPSLDAIKKSSSGISKLNAADSSPSKYYQAVPYSDFDMVINPVVDEPMVQLSYQVSMKFFLAPAEPSHNNELFLITPNGQIQKMEGFHR